MSENNLERIGIVRRSEKNQKIYQMLKAGILDGTYPVGMSLNEQDIAKEAGVGSAPVREAFRLLESEGLVAVRPWKGVVVLEMSDEELRDVMQCREAVETMAMKLSFNAFRNDEVRFRALMEIDEALEQARSVSEESREFHQDTNAAIHNVWIRNGGNQRLIGICNELYQVIRRCRPPQNYTAERQRECCEEHRMIRDAIAELNIEKATAALVFHLQNATDYRIEQNRKMADSLK